MDQKSDQKNKEWWNLSKVGENLVDRAFSVVETELSRYNSAQEQLDRLRTTVDSINALLTDAEQRREINDEAVKLWLRQLKAVAFDSDDLLDSHQTALAVHKLKKGNTQSFDSGEGSSRKRKRFPIPSFNQEWGPFHRRRIVMEIEKIEKRLDDISKNRKTFKFGKDDGRRREPPNEIIRFSQQGPSHDPLRILPRETELNAIVEMLIADPGDVSGSTRTLPVVAIQGAAGIGKTTLARMVYDDSKVKSHFDLKVWVDLTDRSDVTSVMKDIYEKMTRQRCDHGSLTIQENLRGYLDHLENNKFLIVVDNLWKEGFLFWDNLRIPLLGGKEGSKVLITTRSESICRMISPMLLQTNLKGLTMAQCWDLFRSFALPMGVERQDNLVQVGLEIAEKCCGSPLAAKTLGALLNGKDEEEWRSVLDELRVLEQDENGSLSSLLVSYHHLPYPIKRCFAYCCIFPNGYLFEKDQLVRYWLAEGLIPYEGRRRLEHIGTKFFDELMWRSFFEKNPTNDKIEGEKLNYKSEGEKYRLSGLMHDLARLISDYEFVDLTNEISKIKSKAGHSRYASLLRRGTSSVENAYNFTKLRTLIVCSESKTPPTEIPPELFLTLVCLRVLDLGNNELTELPEIADGQLIHLRYLGLSNTNIIKVPDSVCKLYNLQTLELKGCTNLVELPLGISKLVNLRHLGFHVDWEKITDKHSLRMPHGINHLHSLQTLSRFTVASNSDGNCNICEWENLDLRGDLCILNIEKVPMHKPEVALSANLKGKHYIENLMLSWSSSAHSNWEQWAHSKRVMQHLQPNNRLRKLWLINYPGTSFPDWIGDASFSSLEMIRISNCNNVSFLPLLGHLPRLKNLEIDNIPAKTMDAFLGFHSLENLVLSNLPFLEKLSLENEIAKLEKASVSDCPDLKDLVIHQTLQGKIEIRNCPNLPQNQ